MSLTVCLLTRNEEKILPRALASIAGLADQVVVADTGSTDRTREVAAEQGAQVFRIAWDDDFSAGRNAALDRATGEWVLWLNPDEELFRPSRDFLSDALERYDAFAYGVQVQELKAPGQDGGPMAAGQLRLFRNRPEVRYVGRLHPEFVAPLDILGEREQRLVLPSPIVLQRHAYLSQLSEDKLRWAARLLERELQDRPGGLHYLIEYGRTLLLLNDPKGHAVLAQATDKVLAARDAPGPPSGTVQRLLEYVLTVSPAQSLCRMTRDDARELAMRWFPDSPPLWWRLAEIDFQAEDFRRAALSLERLVQFGVTGNYDRSEAFDPTILGELVWMNLGACYTKLQEWDKAEHCYRHLFQNPAFATKAAQNLALVQEKRLQAVRRSDDFWATGEF